MPKIKKPEIFERDGFVFTRSRSGGYHVSCDSCAACVINGLACHETGCPNIRKKQHEDETNQEDY